MWKYTTPVGTEIADLYIPSHDLDEHAFRFIDPGRCRVDKPDAPGEDQKATHSSDERSPPSADFDPHVDGRTLAHNLLTYDLYDWTPHLLQNIGMVPDLQQLVDVLEAMAGVSSWPGWEDPPYYTRDTTPTPYTKPATLLEHARDRYYHLLEDECAESIRRTEFMTIRTDKEGARTPAEILTMPFFDAYRASPLLGTSSSPHRVRRGGGCSSCCCGRGSRGGQHRSRQRREQRHPGHVHSSSPWRFHAVFACWFGHQFPVL